MIYLTQLILNPASRTAWQDVGRPYQLHQTILKAFGCKRADGNILHRVEKERDQPNRLLIQATRPVDLTFWQQRADGNYLLDAPRSRPINLHVGNQPPAATDMQVRLDQPYRFRLIAHPSKRCYREPDENTPPGQRNGNRHSQRRTIFKPADQADWLDKQAAKYGFRVLHVTMGATQQHTIRRKRITLHTVRFDGILHVTDAAQFEQALHNGIGPSKAFGCGLLSLARA